MDTAIQFDIHTNTWIVTVKGAVALASTFYMACIEYARMVEL